MKNGYIEIRSNEFRNTYKGMWLNDKRHGRGKLIWDDGAYFDGEWKHGKIEGFGI